MEEQSKALYELLKAVNNQSKEDLGYNAEDLCFELRNMTSSIQAINICLAYMDNYGDIIPVLQRYERDMKILENRFDAFIGYDDLYYTSPDDKNAEC